MNAVAQEFLEQGPDPGGTREWIEAVISVETDVDSYPALIELRRDGFDCERWQRLHSEVNDQGIAHVGRCLVEDDGPTVAATGYVHEYADRICAFTPDGGYHAMPSADGYGRSDNRPNLRNFFEIAGRRIAHSAIAGGECPGDPAGRRTHNRDLETRSAQAESVDRVDANMQRLVLPGRTCVDSIFRNPTSGSDLSW